MNARNDIVLCPCELEYRYYSTFDKCNNLRKQSTDMYWYNLMHKAKFVSGLDVFSLSAPTYKLILRLKIITWCCHVGKQGLPSPLMYRAIDASRGRLGKIEAHVLHQLKEIHCSTNTFIYFEICVSRARGMYRITTRKHDLPCTDQCEKLWFWPKKAISLNPTHTDHCHFLIDIKEFSIKVY